MTSLLGRLITEEQGQDLVEYALLTAAVSVATVLGIAALGSAVNSVYTAWDTRTQDLWEPQAPAAS
jgi:Flp pilus assembly pilin Flp